MVPMKRYTELEQRSLHCQFKQVLASSSEPDLIPSIKKLLRRRTNPRLGSKRIFTDRIELFNTFRPEMTWPEIPSPISPKDITENSDIPPLSDEQVLAYARAFGILPKSGRVAKKREELSKSVKDAIEKSGKEEERDWDLTYYSLSLAIECDKANEHDINTAQVSHLYEAGYPHEDDNVLNYLNEKCKFPRCKGKYVWRKMPAQKEKPPKPPRR